MEKVTSDDTSISESSGIFNKLPPWLVEMTENVKKLNTPEERITFISTKHFTPDELKVNSTIFPEIPGVTERDNRTDDLPYGSPFTIETPDGVGGCIILQSSTTTSLPNTPKSGYEFPRAISTLSAYSLPGSNENEFTTLDKYLDEKDTGKSADSGSRLSKWDHRNSASKLELKSSEAQYPWSCTATHEEPIEQITTKHFSADVQMRKNRKLFRHQQQVTGKSSRIRIPPYKGTNTQLQSMEEDTTSNLPIGIIKRRQDYLAGVASRGDMELRMDEEKSIAANGLRIEATVLGQTSTTATQKDVSDHLKIADKVAHLNIQASAETNLAEIVKKCVQNDLNQAENCSNPLASHCKRPLYHYERYPPKDDNVNQDFIIPELPRGTKLTIDILTTWGDKHYVGLNGIEIFSDIGESATVNQIWADPTDINVLPEYNEDPRVVSNLINGINQTTDDYNLWLAPYTSGNHHYIHMTFEEAINIAMIRIWNYNKSRIHSYRGVKDVRITLDEVVIFVGEIARASGGVFGNMNSFGDTILFTTDECILELISKHDTMYTFATNDMESPARKETDRPITTDTGEGRPLTCASFNQSNSSNYGCNTLSYVCKEIELVFLSNWGHPSLIGLSGLELIGDQDSVIPLTQASICSNLGNEHLHRLTDGINLTTETNHMWAAYFLSNETVTLTITFQAEIFLTGLRIWNYNGSLDLSYCGVKQMLVKLDGKSVCDHRDGFLLRRAPGCCHYDFVHEINFANQPVITEPSKHEPVLSKTLSKAFICAVDTDYEAPMMPQGFVYQFIIFSTWGDPYYVGLAGIQMYDSNGYLIQLTKDKSTHSKDSLLDVAAYPESVNVIEGVDNDVRTPDKLVDGVNDTADGHHMWLAPILPNQTNRVYIIFDSPVMVSMIKLWNYKKTPQRGVKEFGILVDDLLVYNGVLNNNVPYGQTVLFTTNKHADHESHSLIECARLGHDIKLLNLERRATSGGDCYADPLLRPHTSLMQSSLRSHTTSNM